MNIYEWLILNAEKVPSNLPDDDALIWVTKLRGDYITRVGMEDKSTHLIPLTYVSSIWQPGKPITIGFNEEEKKWYGWSHRAMYGFGIGSECKKGMCHYRPIDKDDFLEQMLGFWSDEYSINIHGEHRDDGVYIEWEYSIAVPNEKIRGKLGSQFCKYPEYYGKGEWTANTLAEARKMAIDFAEGVS